MHEAFEPDSSANPADGSQAQRALLEADLDRCLALCDAAVAGDVGERFQLALVRGRALVRLRQYGAAMELLDASLAEMFPATPC